MLLAAGQSRGIQGSISVSADNEDDDPDYVPDDNDDDDRLSYYLPWGRRPHQPKNWFKPVTEPQKAGVELMAGGDFGRLRAKKIENVWKMLKERELGRKGRGRGTEREDFVRVRKHLLYAAGCRIWVFILCQNLTPNTNGTIVATYGSNAYSGQYSAGELPKLFFNEYLTTIHYRRLLLLLFMLSRSAYSLLPSVIKTVYNERVQIGISMFTIRRLL